MYKQFSQTDRFELLYSGKVNNLIPVHKYKSKKTGLQVIVAQVEGPLVNGFFCLATEAHDDDGLPHTLEHLIFLGSEKYPYKGVLDILANRCLASGTNAWTDTDHTCYTTTHAGSQGFFKLLPVYLDHILYPTIKESGYITEVHHINEEGEDAGVVYCEMQACENGGENRCHTAMLRELYPGECGYKSVTGGVLWNLRESTSHAKVIKYHQDYYKPENLSLIITGKVDPEEVLTILQPVEDEILSKGKRGDFVRPWGRPVPPLSGSIVQTISYASDDELFGMVYVAWRGPLANDQYSLTACAVLLEYLCETIVAPLQREMVEVEEPYCNKVHYSMIENSETCLYVSFHNVPKTRLNEVKEKLFEVLTKISTGAEKIDMQRLADLIHNKMLELASNLEDHPHDTMAFIMIGDILYGKDNEELIERLSQTDTFKKLAKESDSYWVKLLNKYMIDGYSVTIIGNPSFQLMEQMGSKEKARISEQREKLAPEGLKKKGEELENAKNINEIPAPDSVFTEVDVPSVSSIQFHPIKPSCNHSNNKTTNTDSNLDFPLNDIPIAFQLDDIPSNFVTLTVLMDTNVLSEELRKYLPLYVNLVLESPILRDGHVISHEDVIKELAADTLSHSASVGIGGHTFSCGQFSQVACLTLKVELEKCQKAVKWLHELLYQVQFTPERVKLVASKIMKDVAQLKRSGRSVVNTLIKDLLFKKSSNIHLSSMLRQHKFLSSIVEKSNFDEVINYLKDIQSSLASPANLTVHMTGTAKELATRAPPKIWLEDFLPDQISKNTERNTASADFDLLTPFGESTAKITGIGSVESSFMIVTTPCIQSFHDKDLAPLMVYIQYLTQLEGPMWKQIRGLGLAYHYSMLVKPESGLLYLNLSRATHIVASYKQAKEIIEQYLKSGEFSEVEFESCKSSLVFEIIEEEKTPADASLQSMLSYFRGVGADRNRKFINEVSKVTIQDMKAVGEKYLTSLFDSKKSKCSVVCHPSKVQEICTAFKELGRNFDIIDSIDNSFLTE